MRVVSGTARGCKLQPVPGMNTRPTTDRVKENVFNLIQDHVRGAEVLDLFAGTGQLGIEALSRGAAHCDFVEHNKTAYGIVSKNVESARVKDKAALHRTEAAEFVSKAGRERYDVIFLDPPYGGVILENALKQIETFDILCKWYNNMRKCSRGQILPRLRGRAGTPLRRYHDYHSAAAEWRNGMK